jgi:hypothetical protein
MKKILILAFLCLTVTVSAQRFDHFFGPVPNDLIEKTRGATSVWLFRPVVTLTAMQFELTKPVTVASLSSLGTGISYQHFVEADGEPYANFGANLLVLFEQDFAGIEPTHLSFAVTGSLFQYVSVGVGYSLNSKHFFVLTGISYSFN